MDAAVYLQLHHHPGAAGALPLPPPPRRHSAFTSKPPAPAPAPAARLTVSARPLSPAASPALAVPCPASHRSSSRAATGYAAALADACARAGTLSRAARHARAVLSRHQGHRPLPSPNKEEEEAAAGRMDARVAALLRMLVGKGKAAMVPEVLAEFAAICDQLLPAPRRAHHA
ncbi:hypothetical protein BS78_10G277200 [Paspalum vaginatum]|nr:hypothetical protein BS78_10G277200 [Paspalum vaginatum]